MSRWVERFLAGLVGGAAALGGQIILIWLVGSVGPVSAVILLVTLPLIGGIAAALLAPGE